MVLLQRQTSSPATYSVGYGADDSYYTTLNPYQSKSDRSSLNEDPENRYVDRNTHGQKNGKLFRFFKRFSFQGLFTIIQYLAFGATCYYAYTTHFELEKANESLVTLNEDFDIIQEELWETTEHLDHANSEFTKLKTKMNSLNRRKNMQLGEDEVQGHDDRTAVTETLVQRHDAQADRISNLQKSIQDIHRAELEEKYGPGPYRVEATVLIEGKRSFFTIETAPNDLMPHSVRTFMELVESGLYDGTVFIHDTEHITLASPMGTEGEAKPQELTKTLVFPEYSDLFPHDKFTLGFSGRPGGPDFYINMGNNSVDHGPGGQVAHALVEEADSCFGKIIIGKDIVNKFHAMQKKAESLQGEKLLFSEIERMKVLPRRS